MGTHAESTGEHGEKPFWRNIVESCIRGIRDGTNAAKANFERLLASQTVDQSQLTSLRAEFAAFPFNHGLPDTDRFESFVTERNLDPQTVNKLAEYLHIGEAVESTDQHKTLVVD